MTTLFDVTVVFLILLTGYRDPGFQGPLNPVVKLQQGMYRAVGRSENPGGGGK